MNEAKIEYRAKKISESLFSLSIIVTVLDDQRIISPFSTDSSWVKTTITFQDSPKIKPIGPLTEFPVSKEEFDPIMERMVRFNRKEVTFTQTLEILGKKESIAGEIEYQVRTDQYALPPEKIDFVLTYDNSIGSIAME